jgi:hypothetical protein
MGGVELRFRLVGRGNPNFLDLPWDVPLERWDHERLVRMAHGVSRHVVRFVDYDGRVYALKETNDRLAEREYGLLRRLEDERLPTVEPVGVVTGRGVAGGQAAGAGDGDGDEGGALGAVLITRYLDFAIPFRYLFGTRGGPNIADDLVDSLVVLLVRLHLAGFFWGDCSLSNTLFRRDAGSLAAYLVDAETGELLPSLTDGQRAHDLMVAVENIAGELFDLRAAGRLPDSVDPADTATAVDDRYAALWTELTAEEVVGVDERHRIDQRIRRLNDLGFDVEEFELVRTGDGHQLRLQPQVVEAGYHSRRLERLVGLRVQENQARRLLNDLDAFRACIESEGRRPVPEGVAAARWLSEVFEPTIEAIPVHLRGRLEPPELFHEVLEHRWFLSERAHGEVATADAVVSYVDTVLARGRRDEQHLILDDTEVDETPTEEIPIVPPG